MTNENEFVQTDCDWFLQLFTSLVNGSELELGILLLMDGFLVSGKLVGGDKYYDGIAEEIAQIFRESDLAEDIRQSFAEPGEMYRNHDEGSGTSTREPVYLHLKNARFYNTSGHPIPMNRGVWWRGQLSKVTGFTIGELSAEAIG